MELVFTIVLLVLVIFLYVSNQKNKINKWFAIATFICWLGAAKEAALFNIIPFIETTFGYTDLADRFIRPYSLMTWALYSLAMPAMIIFALHFCNMDSRHPKALRVIKTLIWIPAAVLSFFFPPLDFRFYQLNSRAFVIAYSIYGLCLGLVFAFLLIKGVRDEKPGRIKTQKKYLLWCALAPVLFWLLSGTLPYLFEIPSLYKLWRWNVVILTICCAAFFILAFKDGFMGLRLTGVTYNWNSDMSLINKGAEYTGHMLKNQMAKMELCIENLRAQYASRGAGEPLPEELAILSRSISTLKSYTEKTKNTRMQSALTKNPAI